MRLLSVSYKTSLQRLLLVAGLSVGVGLTTASAQVGSVALGAPDRVQEELPVFRFDTRALRVPVDTKTTPTPLQSPHNVHAPDVASRLNNLVPGGVLDAPRVSSAAGASFPGIGSTGWYPPDPSMAVGPNHVLQCVNSSIAWTDRGGNNRVQQTAATFFSGVAQTTFIFDPKCFYDRLNDRFVVLFVEEQDSTAISNALIAVSDDADPTGTWYRYRIDAKLTNSSTGASYWMDYPGFGYTKDAYVVSGNMFGFVSGFAGVQFIVIPNAPLLSGQPASAVSLVDSSGASAQVAEAVDATTDVAFSVSRSGTSALRVYAIQNASTLTPSAVYTSVAVPSNSSPATDAVSTGGYTLDSIDGRVFNAAWRSGRLVTAHSSTPSSGAPLAVRWYEVNTGSWPASGAVSLVQAGLVSDPSLNYFTPAISKNAAGDISLLFTASSSSVTANIMVAGRTAGDPAGAMGTPTVLRTSDGTAYTQGRWGDYFKVEVDPLDDTTFWGVGEFVRSGGSWGTEILSWSVVLTPPNVPASLTATAASSTQINLAWSDSSNETSYTLERSTDGTNFSVRATLNGGVTSFADTGLSPATQYWYRVRAVNGAGTSSYSNTATATTLAPPPAAPSNLTLALATSTSIRLTWVDNSTTETGFKIERSTNGNSWTQIATVLAGVTTYTHTGLRSKTTYYYRVRAYNAAGNSGYSNTASIRTP